MENHIVINNPKDCCGCAACLNICPKDAIIMVEDDAGFIYPKVQTSICVNCGMCKKVCVFCKKNVGENPELKVYAGVINDTNTLEESSSGGVFSALANAVLQKGGVVFGAAWQDDFSLCHSAAQNGEELRELRGSKYVQSFIGTSFRLAKELLEEGRFVCYSGTPCQISGFKSYLGKDYDNLLTVDIICHGVPSLKMLKDDLMFVTGENPDGIRDVKFRDKTFGWGTKGSVITENRKVKYNAGTSPYYFYFLKGEIYRESCYSCRFPSEKRQGDITLGDYWGIKSELIEQLGDINPDLGVSCVLVNTEKGEKWLDEVKNTLSLALSERKSVEKRNGQLVRASTPLPEHRQLLDGYITNGFSSFISGYRKHTKDHIIRNIKNLIPSKIKRKINDFLSKS
ncbi:MAG: Coenzyme F420 hydrogenase/dehydrogenase, beta subunit C-terminal domain [Clostridiales bacterium]|nr:Coenzyme F420 hydrogenase/dehydrogenase, beta subunit C-terminal domain [Clostridiales bacterium]